MTSGVLDKDILTLNGTDVEETLLRAWMVAQEAALAAGDFLHHQWKEGQVQVLQKKALRDDLLDADLKAEKIIIDTLRLNFPDYDILSEETEVENSGSNHRWIVDPLDGSFNFQHGNPTFGISISLLIDNITMVAVVYLPFYREMFTAVRGHGANLNGQPIHVSETCDLNAAIVHVGDFAKDGNIWDNEERLHDIGQLANVVGRVRMIGTAATDLAYVACGRAEALVVHNALPWDIEVGRLLIEEAEGKVTYEKDKDGRSLAICSNKNIHQELLDLILSKKQNSTPAYVEPEYGRLFVPIP